MSSRKSSPAPRRAPKTYVVFLKPAGFAVGLGEDRPLASRRGSSRVIVLRDDEGLEATRFGAFTSGQTLLYDQAPAH